MIRFILRRAIKDSNSSYEGATFYTLDVDVPELEKQLTRGGLGEDGYEIVTLFDVEVI